MTESKPSQHQLAFGDNKADWCKHCGTFAEHCKDTECRPVVKSDRWWPQRDEIQMLTNGEKR